MAGVAGDGRKQITVRGNEVKTTEEACRRVCLGTRKNKVNSALE